MVIWFSYIIQEWHRGMVMLLYNDDILLSYSISIIMIFFVFVGYYLIMLTHFLQCDNDIMRLYFTCILAALGFLCFITLLCH